MSPIKNPTESLQDYFDDLFLEGESASDLPVIPPDSFPSPSEMTAKIARQPEQQANIAAPHFADPLVSQKEKLQKLLYSAQPKIEVAVVEKQAVASIKLASPHFHYDPNEVQEWKVETNEFVADTILPPETTAQLQEAINTYQMPGLEWMPNGLPQWAQARFDVLLFKVSGLTLAVPLITLGKIQPITEALTPLFGQADWFMGLLPTLSGKIRTVNTAKFVMPERYDENFVKNAKYVVSINGVPWGLAVDSVNQPIRLEPDAVNWRTNRSKRPWLAGTIKEHMCALLDIPMIGQMLMDADKNYAKKRLL